MPQNRTQKTHEKKEISKLVTPSFNIKSIETNLYKSSIQVNPESDSASS